jgi:putative PEP-CTERM system TPR-repeat lipoprotein
MLIHTWHKILLLLSVFVCFSAAWAGPVDIWVDPDKPAPTRNELDAYLRQGRYQEVLVGVEAVRLKDEGAALHGMLAVAYAGIERPDQANEEIQMARKSAEVDHALMDLIVQTIVHNGQRQFDLAVKVGRQAVASDSQYPLAHLVLGEAYLGQKEHGLAVDHLVKAISLEPELGHGYTLLGAAYLVRKELDKSLQAYIKGSMLVPLDARPHMGLATIYTGLGLMDKAIKQFETVVRLNPHYRNPRLKLAGLYFQKGAYKEAVASAEAVLATDASVVDAYLILARIHGLQNRFGEGIAVLEDLLVQQPDAPEAGYLLGFMHMAAGRTKAAGRALTEYGRRHPQHWPTKVMLGLLAQEEGRLERAVALFEEALGLGAESQTPGVHFVLANARLAQGEWESAAAHFGRAMSYWGRFDPSGLDLEKYYAQAKPGSLGRTSMAALYLSQGWTTKAAQLCQQVLAEDPESPVALFLEGKILVRQDQWNEAIGRFGTLLKREPSLIGVRFELTELYMLQQETDQALNEYISILEHAPQELFAYLGLASIYEYKGDDDKTLAAYRQIIALAPQSPIGYNQVAYHLAQRQEGLDEALALAQKSLELAPRSGGFLDTLGWVHFKRGEYNEAVRYLETAVEGIPGSSTVRFHLGMAYYEQGQLDKALFQFRTARLFDSQFPEAEEAQRMIAKAERR